MKMQKSISSSWSQEMVITTKQPNIYATRASWAKFCFQHSIRRRHFTDSLATLTTATLIGQESAKKLS